MPVDTLVGPAHLWIPDRLGSYGDEAVDLAARAGRELDEDQKLAVDALLSYGPGGRWLTLEAAIIEGRQNGKTGGVLLPVVLADLFLFGADRIVWTAHRFKTSRDAFADFDAMIARTPELSRRVKKVTYGTGEECIELMSGATLEFLARSRGGGRGLGGKRLVLDEALFLSAEAMGALIPTLSARENPQINYGSSAGVGSSDHLRHLRNRGRAGGDPSLIWVEYCAPGGWSEPGCAAGDKCLHSVGTEGCSLDDEALWAAANHTLGRRISYDYVRSERRALPPTEFGRERLGWFDEVDSESSPVDLTKWPDLADLESEAQDPVAIAVDTTPDRARSAVVIAGRRPDGRVHGEVIDHRQGTGWVVDRLVELCEKWKPCVVLLDPAGPAGAFIPDLEDAGICPKPEGDQYLLDIVSTREAAQACGALADLVKNDRLRHLAQAELTAAVEGAKWRYVGDAKLWDRKTSDVDLTPLVGLTLAAHGLAVHGPTEYDVLDSAW